MQQHNHRNPGAFQRDYTAKEISQYEYCPLVWWHEQYDPAALADSDKLFAQLVALEHEYGSQAPDIPDYQVIEQILVRRGAFEEDFRASQNLSAENEYGSYSDADDAATIERLPKVRRLLRLAFFTLGSGILLVLLSVLTIFIK